MNNREIARNGLFLRELRPENHTENLFDIIYLMIESDYNKKDFVKKFLTPDNKKELFKMIIDMINGKDLQNLKDEQGLWVEGSVSEIRQMIDEIDIKKTNNSKKTINKGKIVLNNKKVRNFDRKVNKEIEKWNSIQ